MPLRKLPGIPDLPLAYGEHSRFVPICATGNEGVFLERFHHKEANLSRSQAVVIGDVCIREEFETCTAAW